MKSSLTFRLDSRRSLSYLSWMMWRLKKLKHQKLTPLG